MKYTNYLPDQSCLAEKLACHQARYGEKQQELSHSQFMVELAHKIASAAPQSYLRFGPYWWIVKSILMQHGFPYYGETEPTIAAIYCGKKTNGKPDQDTSLIAAFEFTDMTNQTEFHYVREFDLYGTEERYVLMDEFMEFGIGC